MRAITTTSAPGRRGSGEAERRRQLTGPLVRAILTLICVAAVVACSEGDGDGEPDRPADATTAAGAPPTETLTPLLERPLPNVADRTFTSAIVEFPPGARAVPHHHGTAFR